MKKLFLIVLSAMLLSCSKEPTPEPEKGIPVKLLSRVSGGGYVKAQILVMESFEGVIYVKYPTFGGTTVKKYRPRIIDTAFVHPTLTKESRLVINYGWGQIEM